MNIDELNIKVSSNTKSAKSGIDNLTSALKVLSEIDLSNIQSLISGLEKISTALTGNKSSTSGANGITKSTREVKKLKAVVSQTTPKVNEIKKTLSEMPSKSISRSLNENELKVIDDAVKRAEAENKSYEKMEKSYSDYHKNRKPLNIQNNKTSSLEDPYYKNSDSLKKLREELSLTNSEYEKAFKAGSVLKTGQDWENFTNKVKQADESLKGASNNGSSAVNKIKGSVANTTPKIEELKEQLRELSNQGLTFGNKKFDSTYQELQKNISALKAYKSDLDNANVSAKKMVLPLNKVSVLLKGLSKAGKSFGKGLLNGAKKAISNGIKPLSEGIKQFKNMLKSMITRSILYTAMSAVRDGFGILAKEDSKFNKSMSRMYSSLMTLKNAFVAAFAPIVETVEPYITSLLNMLTQVVTKVTQVLAALTGSSSATIAKKLTLDYADAMDESSSSTDKAAKSNEKFKKSLMGFDEINKLNGDDASSDDNSVGDNFTMQFTTGGANDLANMIKKAWQDADFTDVGEIISSKIVGMLQRINWEKIKSNAFKGGKSFATLINGLFSYTDKDGNTLATSIGKTIGESFNTLVDFVYGYVSNLKWKNIGTELAKGILKTIKTVNWNKFGTTINEFVTGLLTSISSFVRTLTQNDGDEFIDAVTDFAEGLDLGEIVIDILKLAFDITDATVRIIGNIGKRVLEAICDALGFELDDTGENVYMGGAMGIVLPKFHFTKKPEIEEDDKKSLWEKIVETLKSIEPITMSVGNGIGKNTGKSITSGTKDGIGDIWGTTEGNFSAFWTDITNWFSGKKTGTQNLGKGVTTNLNTGIGNIWGTTGSRFSVFWSSLSSFFSGKKTGAQSLGKGVTTNLNSGIGNIWGATNGKFSSFWSSLNNFFNGKKGNAQGLGSGITSSIKTGLGNNLWSSTSYIFTNFWTDLKNYLGRETLRLRVEWDTTSTLGQALTKLGLQGMPRLSFYAEGGFPNVGELFVANERGAEMVGSLNNRPAVANNQQIENALENAIYRGMMAAGSNGGNSINLNVTVPLDEAILGRAMVDYHNCYVRSTGGSPLIIGG